MLFFSFYTIITLIIASYSIIASFKNTWHVTAYYSIAPIIIAIMGYMLLNEYYMIPHAFSVTLLANNMSLLALYLLICWYKKSWRSYHFIIGLYSIVNIGFAFMVGLITQDFMQIYIIPHPTLWTYIHSYTAIIFYNLLVLSALFAWHIHYQKKRIKSQQLHDTLYPIAVLEKDFWQLLRLATFLLCCAFIAGIAIIIQSPEIMLVITHKYLLVSITLFLLLLLHILHYFNGVRFAFLQQYALALYILITLAYPGVLFVTNIIL